MPTGLLSTNGSATYPIMGMALRIAFDSDGGAGYGDGGEGLHQSVHAGVLARAYWGKSLLPSLLCAAPPIPPCHTPQRQRKQIKGEDSQVAVDRPRRECKHELILRSRSEDRSDASGGD